MAGKKPKRQYAPGTARALILFAVFVVLACGGIMAAVIFLPVDLPASGPANTPGNLMNGGRVVIGDERVYYTDPTGIYSFADSTPAKQAKLSDKPADRLFFQGGKVYFVQEGALYSSLFDGSLKTEVFRGFDDVQIIGSWLYYTKDGTLRKRRAGGELDSDLKIETDAFYILSQTVYYLAPGGKIYSARTDGTARTLFADAAAERFMIDGNYLFYRSESGIRSLSMADRKTGDRLPGAGAFHASSDSFFYAKDGGVYLKKLGDEKKKDKKLADYDADEFYICGEYLYFSKQKGAVNRIRVDGTELRQISGATK